MAHTDLFVPILNFQSFCVPCNQCRVLNLTLAGPLDALSELFFICFWLGLQQLHGRSRFFILVPRARLGLTCALVLGSLLVKHLFLKINYNYPAVFVLRLNGREALRSFHAVSPLVGSTVLVETSAELVPTLDRLHGFLSVFQRTFGALISDGFDVRGGTHPKKVQRDRLAHNHLIVHQLPQLRSGWAVILVLFKQFENYESEVVGVEFGQLIRPLIQDLLFQERPFELVEVAFLRFFLSVVAVGVERRLESGHVVHETAQTPHVEFVVNRPLLEDFRWQVQRSANF